MAGLPKVIASRPVGQEALSTAPSCYCPRRRVSNRNQTLLNGPFPSRERRVAAQRTAREPGLAFDRSGVQSAGRLPRRRAYGGQCSGTLAGRRDAAELDVLVAADRLGEARELERAGVGVGRLPAQRPSDQSLVPRDQPPLLAPD